MNIIVTGGAGFIGSHVVDLLVKKGHTVLILDNLSTGRQENINTDNKVHFMKVDIRISNITEIVEDFKPKAILNLAAQAAITTALIDPRKDLLTNGIGTINMLELAKKTGAKFVYASTSAVYGDKVTKPLTEDMELRPDNPYGISKLCGEMYARIYDVDATILRFGNVYGPRQVPIGENQVIARMLGHLTRWDEFKIFGDGMQKRDFVYVEDVARAVVMAIKGTSGVYNIASGFSHSVNEVGENLADLFGIPGYSWEHDHNRQDERRNVQTIVERAEKDLTWRATTPIRLGLLETKEWWLECQKERF